MISSKGYFLSSTSRWQDKMIKFIMGLLILASIVLIFTSVSQATIYYIRTDGGTAEQCNGTVDAPYSGSGTNQPCAWSHPYWAINSEGIAWRINGGDTLVISPGVYMIGYGAPNTTWCSPEAAYDCKLPPLPSGTVLNPTRLVGKDWDAGCPNPPELWGTQRVDYILNLDGTSHAVVDCLEITDHSSCAENYDCTPPTWKCERDTYPYGEWASRGIYAADSTDVTLRHLNIHGLADAGVHAGRLTDWTVEDVSLIANGMCGWDGDLWDGGGSSNSGTLTFRKLAVEWTGCPETYPDKQPDHCFAQELCNGFSDGFAETRTGGHWIFEDSLFRYNASDGLDLLYVGLDHPDTMVEIKRTMAYGNAGNQIKVGGSSTIINTLVDGNCGYFFGKSFGLALGPRGSGNHCRAGGGAVSLNPGRDDSIAIVNSTIVSEGWTLIEAQCITKDFPDQPACNGTASVTLQNNIFRGYEDFVRNDETLSHFVGDGDLDHLTDGKVDYNVIYNAQVLSSTGSHDIMQDPQFVDGNLESFNGHLQSTSPAIDKGLPVGGLNGLIPADDLEGGLRPVGSGVDMGAYEYGTGIITTTIPPDTTTSTSAGSTTTTHPPEFCPPEELYGEHSEETELLRHFRDSILSQTPEGQELIRLYYEWSPMVVKAMEEDKRFKEEVKGIVDEILPLIGGEME